MTMFNCLSARFEPRLFVISTIPFRNRQLYPWPLLKMISRPCRTVLFCRFTIIGWSIDSRSTYSTAIRTCCWCENLRSASVRPTPFESKSEAGRSRELSCPYRQGAKNRKPHAIARLTINIWTPQNYKQFPKTIGEVKFCFTSPVRLIWTYAIQDRRKWANRCGFIKLVHSEGCGLKVGADEGFSRVGNAYDISVLRERSIGAHRNDRFTGSHRYPPVRLLRISFALYQRVGIFKSEHAVRAYETDVRLFASGSLLRV